MNEESLSFECPGFFAMRTALLPFNEFVNWGADLRTFNALNANVDDAMKSDRETLRSRLMAVVASPVVREAIFVASPSLYYSMDKWYHDPECKDGRRTELALIRYFERMAGRATPFGLFAGCSKGMIGDSTKLEIESAESARRSIRLDMGYLEQLIVRLIGTRGLVSRIPLRPNSSLYAFGGQLRYVEARARSDGARDYYWDYFLSSAEPDEYLQQVLEQAASGRTKTELMAACADWGFEESELSDFIDELVRSGILVPDLQPALTGETPLRQLANDLRLLGISDVASQLDNLQSQIEAFNRKPLGVDAREYQQLTARVQSLEPTVSSENVFQIDMYRSDTNATLSTDVVHEIRQALQLLARCAPEHRGLFEGKTSTGLARFVERFKERYDQREVLLCEALDEEGGIGFSARDERPSDLAPLIEKVPFGRPPIPESIWRKRESVLAREVIAACRSGVGEILLNENLAAALEAKVMAVLPSVFNTVITVAHDPKSAWKVLLHDCTGPGLPYLGRFCADDDVLCQMVMEVLAFEEQADPESIYAEIVHLPQGRAGNVIVRPRLRAHEIPYLGRGLAPQDLQIPVQDLTVRVVGERVVLRSRKLNKRVVPRLGNMHFALYEANLPVYKFLFAVQKQDGEGPSWDWGALETFQYLPQVTTGRVVVARARWIFSPEEWEQAFTASGAARYRAVQEMRDCHSLPRLVTFSDRDNELLVDFGNINSIDAFAAVARSAPKITLRELFADPEQLIAEGPSGRYVHEIVLPLRLKKPSARQPKITPPVEVRGHAPHHFAPGSEWLFAKIYSGTTTADRLLREPIRRVVMEAMSSGYSDRWFFIRYADPEPHLRLRFHGPPQVLTSSLLPLLHDEMAPWIQNGAVWTFSLDVYRREVERYGGEGAIELAEQWFQEDSRAALDLVASLQEAGPEARWQAVLAGCHALLRDFGTSLPERLHILQELKENTADGRFEMSSGETEGGLSTTFRKYRSDIEALLRPDHIHTSMAQALEVIRNRSAHVATIVADLKEMEAHAKLRRPLPLIVGSLTHMFINRVLHGAQLKQEFVIYDFLMRTYRSWLARSRQTSDPALSDV